ncbi:MAG: hypothetical protein ACJATT_001280 [Myxococcota bacterium]|jgi:hypothetical protein
MRTTLLLFLTLQGACVLTLVDGSGNRGQPTALRYTEQDYLDDVTEIACEYVMQCFEMFASMAEGEGELFADPGPCLTFIPDQARACVDDFEAAVDTCADSVTDDESACANVCG